MKEYLNKETHKEKEIKTIIDTTKKWLFGLEKGIFKNFFSNILNKFKNLFWIKKNKTQTEISETETDTNTKTETRTASTKIDGIAAENIEWQIWWDTVSNEMLQQLLNMEWKQNFTAKIHWKNFWETFVTGPYWMVYKHIDKNWHLLKQPTTFQDWEQVSPIWAKENAKAYYNKKAKQWKKDLYKNWCKYTQNMLDALVSASWWTVASYNHLKKFVISHRNDKEAIYNFRLKFATKAAWNGKVMPWLVRRRKFEANRFKWIKQPFRSYTVK